MVTDLLQSLLQKASRVQSEIHCRVYKTPNADQSGAVNEGTWELLSTGDRSEHRASTDSVKYRMERCPMRHGEPTLKYWIQVTRVKLGRAFTDRATRPDAEEELQQRIGRRRPVESGRWRTSRKRRIELTASNSGTMSTIRSEENRVRVRDMEDDRWTAKSHALLSTALRSDDGPFQDCIATKRQRMS